jgi:hypothetical protein
LPAHVIRCNGHMVNGGRCKHEAEPGSVVCHLHGGAAPQVRKRAAERLIMSADHVSQKLLEWLDDPEVPYRVRAEIAQDLLDRAGLAQVIKVVATEDDPIVSFFRDAFNDPTALEDTPPPGTRQPAIEAYVVDPSEPNAEPGEILEAELVDREGVVFNDTPPKIKKLLDSGAFGRKAGT